jgi:hypothetical protein
MWWGHVASCVFIVITTLWWSHIALSSCIACTSSQCYTWTAHILFFYFDLAKCICPLCWSLKILAYFHMIFFVEILKNCRRIGVLYGTSSNGFQ